MPNRLMCDVVPNMTAVLAGAAIVPAPDINLREGEVVSITAVCSGLLDVDLAVV